MIRAIKFCINEIDKLTRRIPDLVDIKVPLGTVETTYIQGDVTQLYGGGMLVANGGTVQDCAVNAGNGPAVFGDNATIDAKDARGGAVITATHGAVVVAANDGAGNVQVGNNVHTNVYAMMILSSAAIGFIAAKWHSEAVATNPESSTQDVFISAAKTVWKVLRAYKWY